MSSIKRVVIAAAGIGKRLGRGKPKCLIEVGGHPIFEYQLALFREVEEVRIVVGFQDEDVIRAVTKIRQDIVFVRNPAFQTTSSLQSMFLGCRGLKGNCLFVDGDMIISRSSFCAIENQCAQERQFAGVASDISDDPVFALVENGLVTGFSTEGKHSHEWANLAYLDASYLENRNTPFYEQLQKRLPMKALQIERLEIDTPEDLQYAENFLSCNQNFCSCL